MESINTGSGGGGGGGREGCWLGLIGDTKEDQWWRGGGGGGGGEEPRWIFRVAASQSSGVMFDAPSREKKDLHHRPADCSASKTTFSSTRATVASRPG